MEQHDSYGTISSTYLEYFADHVGLFDEYIAMRTGENQYQCLIKNIDGSVDLISVDRVGTSGYNYYYQATVTESTWDYSYTNELYVYSNIGIGQQLPVEYDHITAIGVVAICTLLVLKAVFPVLFRPWGRGRTV